MQLTIYSRKLDPVGKHDVRKFQKDVEKRFEAYQLAQKLAADQLRTAVITQTVDSHAMIATLGL